jgi:signal transduction histidine kinase
MKIDATAEKYQRWNETVEGLVEEHTNELITLYEHLEGKEAICKQLLGAVLTAQEEERTRLARELHDSIGQSLTAIIMNTGAVENSLPPGSAFTKEKLANVRGIAAQALQDLRNLIYDLRPEALGSLGLVPALRSQVEKYLESAGVEVQLKAVGLKDSMPADMEIAIFRVVQEGITNIARHAEATNAQILLNRKADRLIVRIEDNGGGFDPSQIMNGNMQAWGLRGMKERITLLGGEFYIGSKPGSGTLILAEVPMERNLGFSRE